jgi:hypothetical protein
MAHDNSLDTEHLNIKLKEAMYNHNYTRVRSLLEGALGDALHIFTFEEK